MRELSFSIAELLQQLLHALELGSLSLLPHPGYLHLHFGYLTHQAINPLLLQLQPGDEQPFTVTGNARGIFEYDVSVRLAAESTTRARGGSNPKIIII